MLNPRFSGTSRSFLSAAPARWSNALRPTPLLMRLSSSQPSKQNSPKASSPRETGNAEVTVLRSGNRLKCQTQTHEVPILALKGGDPSHLNVRLGRCQLWPARSVPPSCPAVQIAESPCPHLACCGS